MKLQRSLFRIAIFIMAAAVVSPFFLPDARAFRGEERGYYGGADREGGYVEGPRGGAAAVGPYGGAAVRGPEGNAAVRGPYGGVAVRGPEGNVAVGRAVGDRVAILPDNASAVAVGDQMYYVDGSVYYLPCADDNTVYCVVPAPQ
jgi:hypothetical protein